MESGEDGSQLLLLQRDRVHGASHSAHTNLSESTLIALGEMHVRIHISFKTLVRNSSQGGHICFGKGGGCIGVRGV